MRFSQYVTDRSLEERGVWVRLNRADPEDPAEVLVARAGNSEHEKLVRRLRKKNGRGFRGDDLPPAVEEEIAVEAIAETILLDWRGIQDDGGNEIPYSAEKAKELLRLSRDFRMEVVAIATESEIYRAAEVAEGKKSSKK